MEKKRIWFVILEYKRRLLKSRPGVQKVGNRGNLNHKPGGSKHRRKAAKRRVQREPVMEAGAVVVLRQVPLEWL